MMLLTEPDLTNLEDQSLEVTPEAILGRWEIYVPRSGKRCTLVTY